MKLEIRASVLAFVVLALASQTYAAIVNGEDTSPLSDGSPTESDLAQQVSPTVIDFDDFSAPLLFNQTTALREEYAYLGVHFTGPTQNDGGAILDDETHFGVPAHSGENFLAFNRKGQMGDGGIPTGSETIQFDQLMAYISIYAAGAINVDEFTMDAYDALGSLIDSDAVATQQWAELSVSSQAGISRVVLTQTGDHAFVYDDLSFQPIPEPATLLMLAVGGLALLRKRTQ